MCSKIHTLSWSALKPTEHQWATRQRGLGDQITFVPKLASVVQHFSHQVHGICHPFGGAKLKKLYSQQLNSRGARLPTGQTTSF